MTRVKDYDDVQGGQRTEERGVHPWEMGGSSSQVSLEGLGTKKCASLCAGRETGASERKSLNLFTIKGSRLVVFPLLHCTLSVALS